jgi:hypothetical protein
MQLPHVDEAQVPDEKVLGYLLSPDHPSGRSKASFFSALGFRREQPADLRQALLQHAATDTVSSVRLTQFGAKYVVDGQIRGPAGTSARIRSVWFVETNEIRPRLITAYPFRGVRK